MRPAQVCSQLFEETLGVSAHEATQVSEFFLGFAEGLRVTAALRSISTRRL
jgi:hypothetical protein